MDVLLTHLSVTSRPPFPGKECLFTKEFGCVAMLLTAAMLHSTSCDHRAENAGWVGGLGWGGWDGVVTTEL